MSMNNTQRLARWYGYFGLIPFVLLTLVVVSGFSFADSARVIFDQYSAVILAFMAGIYWPIALREEGPVNPKRLMVASIGLALWSWVILVFPETFRALAFALGFLFLFGIDRWVLDVIWSNIYLAMRFHLTMVVITCQLLVAVFA